LVPFFLAKWENAGMKISTLARLPETGSPDLLFLLFHAAGSSAKSMSPLALRLTTAYPQSAVLCVDAPLHSELDTEQRTWFLVNSADEQNSPTCVAQAMPEFIAVVRALQQRFGVSWQRTALFGFAQGALMALEAVQAEPELAGRVLAFAGRHAQPPAHVPTDTTVHFFHGLQDGVVPHGPAIDSAQRLAALGGDVTADVLPGIGHELHPELIEKSINQLRSFLPKKVWREAMEQAPLISRVASSDELGVD
jgi:phospholipase/carboxylesterase